MMYKYGVTVLLSLALPNLSSGQSIEIDNMIIVAQNDYQSVTAAAVNQANPSVQPVPSDKVSKSQKTKGLFAGLQSGYVHPYLTVKNEYTDNLYNVDTDTTSNFLTTISPGIWFALPRTKTIPITLTPHNTSAGGLRGSLASYQGYERIQAYLLGGMDFKNYSEDSNLNEVYGKVEGLFRYSLRGGLSFQLVERYGKNQDRFAVDYATADNLRRYDTNLAIATADWTFSPKLRAKFDISNFYLDYTEVKNNALNRSDNSASLTGYYKYSPKTSFFIGYRFVDVAYDTNEGFDNKQNFVHGGIRWTPSEKTTLSARAGYQKRSYQDDTVNSSDSNKFTAAIGLDYRITPKTSITLSVNRQSEEADIDGYLGQTVLSSNLQYRQNFTERISGNVDLGYTNAEYDSLTPPTREDKRYHFKPGVQYKFRNWLMFEASYRFDKRDSTDDLYDYDSHTVMFTLNSSL